MSIPIDSCVLIELLNILFQRFLLLHIKERIPTFFKRFKVENRKVNLKTPFAHTTTSSYKLLTIQESENYLFVNPNSVRHEILGIGGAITDASAVVYDACSSEMKAKIMQAYFDPEYGLGYSVVRTTVHSCDFSPASYCYVKK